VENEIRRNTQWDFSMVKISITWSFPANKVVFSKWRHLCILRTNYNLCTKKWKCIILHFILPCWWLKYNRNVDSKFYEYVINMSSMSVVQVNNSLFSSFSGYRWEWWRQYYSWRIKQSLQLCTKCKLTKNIRLHGICIYDNKTTVATIPERINLKFCLNATCNSNVSWQS
jgi:hypothetical protein